MVKHAIWVELNYSTFEKNGCYLSASVEAAGKEVEQTDCRSIFPDRQTVRDRRMKVSVIVTLVFVDWGAAAVFDFSEQKLHLMMFYSSGIDSSKDAASESSDYSCWDIFCWWPANLHSWFIFLHIQYCNNCSSFHIQVFGVQVTSS